VLKIHPRRHPDEQRAKPSYGLLALGRAGRGGLALALWWNVALADNAEITLHLSCFHW